MTRATHARVWAIAAVLVAACGDDATPLDAGTDAATVDAPLDGGVSTPVAPAELPRFTPCPTGWREVTLDVAGGLVVCDPWPEAGPATCPGTDVHLPGQPGCTPVASACPTDGWPAELPAGATVVYVRAGVTSGDGTRAAPYATIAEALSAASAGDVIALAVGEYDEEQVVIERDVTIVGACDETVLRGDSRSGAVNIDGVSATLRNLRVSSTMEGVWSFDSSVTLEHVVIEDVGGVGVSAFGGTLTASDLLIRRVGSSGVAITVGCEARLERTVIEDSLGDGIRGAGGTATVLDSVIRRTGGPDSLPYFGADEGGLTMERSVIDDPRGDAVLSTGPVTIVLRDVVISGADFAEARPETTIAAVMGGTLTLERARLERMREVAVLVADGETRLALSDVAILSVRAEGTSAFGHGVEMAFGADATIARVLVDDATGLGLLVDGSGTDVTASDVTVLDMRANSMGHLGRAVQVQRGSHLDLSRGLFTSNREACMVAAGTLTTAMLSDVIIEQTSIADCAAIGCPRSGIGVGVYERGAASITRFRIRDNALLGLQIASDGQLDLDDGEVRGHPIGANVQVPGYDLNRLTSRVQYRDNDTNLDTATLPVPDATTTPMR